MNDEIKQQWLSALRSGDYKQAQKALHPVGGGHCCLGVLCDLWLNERGETWQVEGYDYLSDETYQLDEAHCEGAPDLLPLKVQKWAGLANDNPAVLVGKDEWKDLAYLNDHGWTFEQIADVIEAQL